MSTLPFAPGHSLTIRQTPTGEPYIVDLPYEELDQLTDAEHRSMTEAYIKFFQQHYPTRAIRVPSRMTPEERKRWLAYLDDEPLVFE